LFYWGLLWGMVGGRLIDSESEGIGWTDSFFRKFDLKISVWISVNVNQNVAGIEFFARLRHETTKKLETFCRRKPNSSFEFTTFRFYAFLLMDLGKNFRGFSIFFHRKPSRVYFVSPSSWSEHDRAFKRKRVRKNH
jgi:hypothetical protein